MKRTGWIRLLGVMLAFALLGSLLVACGGGKKFTVTFDSDGGSAVSSVVVTSGSLIEEPVAPTKDGYTFVKWVNADGSDFKFDTDVVGENITLKAIWKLYTYTITFNTNGGTSINTQEVGRDGLVEKPSNPVKAGFAFGGWYADENYTVRFDFANTKITQDTVIYAYFTPEIEDTYTVNFVGSDTPIEPQTTSGGVLTELPTPVKEGKTFVGWWMSDFEDEQKLTCQYFNQVLTQNTTLFAVWESAAPAVSVTASGISWKSKGVNVTYTVTITSPAGEARTHSQSTVTHPYDFAGRDMGEYKIEVTWNNNTTTAYYNNKALSRVSLFEVDGFQLKYNAVANAEKYLITAVCGNHDKSHVEEFTEYDNGNSTVFNLEACQMQKEGITFVVKAIADGYVASVSEPFVFERGLAQVSGIAVNAENEQFTWDPVEHAQYYMVKIGDGEYRRVDALTSTTVKEYAPGQIEISVYAVAHGWNASEPAAYTYEKIRLATPVLGDVKIEGQTLSWAEVANANGYRVKIGETVYNAADNEMQLPEGVDWTNMQISIQAVGASAAEDSLFTEIKKFAATLDGQVTYADGAVSWATILGVSKYAVKVNDGAAVEVTDGTSLNLTFDKSGTNTIAVCFYDKDGVASEWETISVEIFAVTLAYNFEGYENYAVLYRAQGDSLNLPTLVDVTLSGYDFRFWSGTTDGVVEYISPTLDTAADMTLYAKWEPKQYTVSFSFSDEEGTLSGSSEAIVTYREGFALPVLVSKDPCKTFYGWFESPNGAGIQYTDYNGNGLDIWKQANNKTLYAGWIDIFTFTPVEHPVYGTVYSVAKAAGIDLVTSVKIPAYYNGRRVAYIYSTAFEGCANLETIDIPDTILQIDTGSAGGNQVGSAFLRCNSIKAVNIYIADPDKTYETFYKSADGVLIYRNVSVGSQLELAYFPPAKDGAFTVPDDVQVIPQYVFKSAKVTEVTIPASVIRIDANAFDSCLYITKITFTEDAGDQLTIHETALKGCTKMEEITFPARLSELKPVMLSNCSSLQTINFVGEGSRYASVDGYVTDAAKTTLIYAPYAKNGTVTIPTGITTIAEEAFANTFLSSTTGEISYRGTKIEKLIVPGYVTTIEKNAFRGNTYLVTIEFAEDSILPLTIGEAAFYGCRKLVDLVLPINLTTLGQYAFGATPSGTSSTTLTNVTVNSSGLGKELNFAAGAFSSIPGLGTHVLLKNVPTYYVTDLHLGPQVPALDIAGIFGPELIKVTVDPANDNLASDEYGVLYNKALSEILFYPTGREGTFVVPTSVTKIGNNIFSGKEHLTGITIPGSVTSIGESAFKDSENIAYIRFEGEGTTLTVGDNAFYGCDSLTELVLPEYTTSLGNYALAYCTGLTSFTTPASVKTIGDYAFRNCSALITLTLSEGVETIGQYAFAYCRNMERVYIPASLTTIADNDPDAAYAIYNVFNYCNALKEIVVAESSNNFASIDGLLYGKTEDENGAFVVTDLYFCPINVVGVEGVIDIPQTVNKIHAKAFYQNAGVLEIKFSNGIIGDSLEIGADAFSECKTLRKVELPSGLKTVSANMFKKCVELTEIVIPNTVTLMETRIFDGCTKLSTVTFEAGGTEELVLADGTKSENSSYGYTYYYGVFTNCPGLTEIALPERTTKIGAYAFAPYSYNGVAPLETLTIPASVTEIGAEIFGDTTSSTVKLQNVIFADAQNSKLTTIGKKAFYNCKLLTSIEIPASVTTIGDYAFGYCYGLNTLTFGEGSKLETFGNSVFYYCQELRGIELPASLTTMGTYVFNGCSKLSTVTFAPNSNLTKINTSTFANCSALQSIVIPAKVSSIETNAFSGCTSLSSLTFETFTEGEDQGKSYLSNIGDSAFAKTALTEFRFPVSTQASIKLGVKLFTSAKHLATVYLSKSVTSIDSVFKLSYVRNIIIDPENENFKADANAPIIYNVQGTAIQLTYGALYGSDGVYIIPEGTVEIGERAFENQVYIRKIIIPNTVLRISDYAFANCMSLEEVVFLTDAQDGSGYASISELGEGVFDNCQSLKSIDLSRTDLKFLPAYTFRNCSSLEEVKLPEFLCRIGYDSDTAKTTDTYTFFNCISLKEINFPDSLTAINGARNFAACSSLTKVVLPKSLVTLGQYSFAGCSGLKEVVFQSNVKNIGTSPFYYSIYDEVPIEKIVLYSGMTKLGANMFQYLGKLTTVTYDGYEGEGNALPKSIIEVGNYAFRNCESLTNLALPGVTKSGTYVFNGCTQLSSVTLNDNLKTLGNYMFKDCTALREITLPSKLTALGTNTFHNSGLESIVIPEGVTMLGTSASLTAGVYAFAECENLTSVTLPSKLTVIGAYVFQNCSKLSAITYTGYAGEGNALPKSVTLVGKCAFSGCASLKQLDLPGVTKLGEYAFGVTDDSLEDGITSGIETVTLPALVKGDSTSYLANYTFANCTSLTSVTLSDDLNALSNYMFKNCTALKTIKLPSKLVYMGTYTFRDSGIESITIPDTVEHFGTKINTAATASSSAYVFDGCENLVSVTMSSNLKTIGAYVFRNCSKLSTITYTGYEGEGNSLPETTTLVGNYAFYGCSSLAQIALPGVATLGTYVFSECSALSQVDLGDSLKTLPNSTFSYCTSLAEITLPDSLTEVGVNAFFASGLTTIEIPAGVTSVGNASFSGCGSLTGFTVAAANTKFKTDANGFLYTADGTLICVPKTASGKVVLADDCKEIGSYAFNGCGKVTEIVIPASVTSIGASAFYGVGITSIVIPETVTEIGGSAFKNSALTTVEIKGTPEFGTYVFAGCSNLATVMLNDEITALGTYMFEDCTSLTEITLPSKLVYMGYYTFRNSGLVSIVIPESVEHLSNKTVVDEETDEIIGAATATTGMSVYLFAECANLTSVTLPSNLQTAGAYIFANCSKLTTITYTGYEGTGNALPESLTLIGDYMFSGCTSLKQLSLPGVETTGTRSFAAKDSSSDPIVASGIESVSLPSITKFGDYLFKGCEFLTTVELNDELTALGKYTFQDCTALKSITLPSTLTFLGTYTFRNTGIESIVIPESVIHIGTTADTAATVSAAAYVFADCANLTSVTLPSRLQTLGGYMFYNCSNLTTITYTGYTGTDNSLPATTTIAGAYAFSGCTSLEQLSLPGVEKTGSAVFGAEDGKIEDGLTVPSGIRIVSLPSLETAGSYLFENCTSLVSVELGDTLTTLSTRMFKGCTALQNVELPESVTTLGISSFAGCTGIQNLYIPAGVTGGSTAFTGWTSAQTIHVADSWYVAMCSISTYTSSWIATCEATIDWEYTKAA